MRKRIITLSAALAALGLIGAGALSAQAHDGAVEATCTGGLTINLTNYPNGSTIGGTIDGEPYDRTEFDGSYSDTITWTPTVNHEYNLSVTSGDGDTNYDRTFSAAVTGCVPTPTEPPTTQTPTPPVTETPKPQPTPTVVVAPHVQDYITCKGAAFVLDNTGSNVDVRYLVAGKPFDVAAGTAVHTDADGYLFPTDIGVYVISTYPGDKTWAFAPPKDCEATTPPTTEPTPTPTDEPTTPTPTDEPTTPVPTDEPTTPVTEPTKPATTQPTQQATTPPVQHAGQTPAPTVKVAEQDNQQAGTLAYTGSQINPWIVAFAALAIALGIAALVILPRIRHRFTRSGE